MIWQGQRTSSKIKFIYTLSSIDRKSLSTSFYHTYKFFHIQNIYIQTGSNAFSFKAINSKLRHFPIKLYLNYANKSEVVWVNSLHYRSKSLLCLGLFSKEKACLMCPPAVKLSCCLPILIKSEICFLGHNCWEINKSSSFVMPHSYARTLFSCKMLC